MTEFVEQNVLFTFDESWSCEKWDDCDVYRNGIAVLQGTQAVDFLGVHGDSMYLIEVKDFRAHRIESKNVAGGEIHYWSTEIACKVRDTIAGIMGAALSGGPNDIVIQCSEILGARELRNVHVVAWIIKEPQPIHPNPKKQQKIDAVNKKRSEQWREALKKRLGWLTVKVKHSNPFESPRVPGVTVRNLPRNETKGALDENGNTAQDDREKRIALLHRLRGIEEECRQMGIALNAPVRQGLDALAERLMP
ncbi:MAG: hypothetical protein HC927_01730 [Deltaproteobacteria bacterium]|nr:hypothetical protein [Deltaproteobacteria bacterium]